MVLFDGALSQVLIALPQIAAEVLRAVPVNFGVGVLDFVEDVANLPGRHGGMSQVFDKFVEGALEIDIVLPQRIVGIHNQVLTIHFAFRGARRKGISKIASTSMGKPPRVAGSNCHLARASEALRSRRSSRWRISAIESMVPFFRI